MMDTGIAKRLNKPISFGSQLVLSMAASAFAPMIVLIAVGYAFFYDSPDSQLSFQYWSFLVVIWVLSIAFLVARLLAGGLMKQLDTLATAANVPGEASTATSNATNDFVALEEKFNQIEAVVAEGRASSLGRIRDLEGELAGMREAAELQAKFLSAVSHEIRTPLSAIVSSARIIQRYHHTKPEVIARFGDTIITEGNRLVRSISDMLDLVKIEAGTLSWTEELLVPGDLAEEVSRGIEPLIEQHELELTTAVPDGLPLINGDAQRVKQVLANMLRNAVKYTPAGGKVSLSADLTDDGEVRFSVTDTGVGISPEMLPRIFEKSYVLNQRKQSGRKEAGVGLGLALCREIVDHHGGQLRAQSDPGRGSTFEILFPAVLDEAPGASAPARERRRERVLLLMKNDLLADCAIRALRLEELDSRICSSLQEFFTTLDDWCPDLVIMSSSFAWNMNADTEQSIRATGVAHILLFSAREGLVELTPPTNTEPVVAALDRKIAKGSTVLLVEDDEEYGAVMEFELSQVGYKVIKAYNGVDGLERAVNEKPAALVLDLALPQLDGFGVMAQLAERNAELPTVVLTALDDSALDEKLAELGALAVFRKYELIEEKGADLGTRVREILAPVLAATIAAENPGDASATQAGGRAA